MNSLKGKVALITGSSKGLGKAIIIYVASSTTSFPVPGMAVYGSSKTTPKYLVEVLAKEIGHKGVMVNSIIPFAVDSAGPITDPESYPESRKQLLNNCPWEDWLKLKMSPMLLNYLPVIYLLS